MRNKEDLMENAERFAGVWLDFREARIVFLTGDGDAHVEVISSEVDEGKAKGGSRSKTIWGPMDQVSETGHQRRKEQQIKKYMQCIASTLKGVSEIAIMGPGEAKLRLIKYFKSLSGHGIAIRKVESADSNLSDKQLIASFRAMVEA